MFKNFFNKISQKEKKMCVVCKFKLGFDMYQLCKDCTKIDDTPYDANLSLSKPYGEIFSIVKYYISYIKFGEESSFRKPGIKDIKEFRLLRDKLSIKIIETLKKSELIKEKQDEERIKKDRIVIKNVLKSK